MNAKQLYAQAYSDRRAIKSHICSVEEWLKTYSTDERTTRISENANVSYVRRNWGLCPARRLQKLN